MDNPNTRYIVFILLFVLGSIVIYDVAQRMIASGKRLDAIREAKTRKPEPARPAPPPVAEAKVEIFNYRYLYSPEKMYFEVRYTIGNNGRLPAVRIRWKIRPFSKGLAKGDEITATNPEQYNNIVKEEYLALLKPGQTKQMKARFMTREDVDPGHRHGDFELTYETGQP